MPSIRVDVLVFGAGHAGLAFAIHAAQRGARIALVDRRRRRPKIGEIVEAALQVPLAKLGVWEAFLGQRHLRSTGTLSMWTGAHATSRSAIVNPFGGGWFVDRARFDTLLREAAAAVGVIICEYDARPTAAADGFAIETPDGVLLAPLAIEATGRHGSAVSSPARREQDDLVALTAYTAGACPDRQFRLEAVDEGWWYAAPLPEGRQVMTLMTLMRLFPRDRTQRLAFWRRSLDRSRLLAPLCTDGVLDLAVFPATGAIRKELSGARWLAVGDAAAAYDPLHGLGIVAALTKGIAAATLLTSSGKLQAAFELYTDTERDGFAAYDQTRRRLYAEAAVGRRQSLFWSAFPGPT